MSSILALMLNDYAMGVGQNEDGFAFPIFEPYACRTKSRLGSWVTAMRDYNLFSEGDGESNFEVDIVTNCSWALLASAYQITMLRKLTRSMTCEGPRSKFDRIDAD
jgi:hypothetical protein